MLIERMQVDEGFLDGLDVKLVPGLNVVIGERGTGKTSLIELIRFCLDVSGYSSESAKKSRDHARSVLGSGQVTMTLIDGARKVLVSRTASDPKPRSSGPYQSPIIFSQTEIESVGLHAGGRLKLLDGFVPTGFRRQDEESAITAEIKSLCSEGTHVRSELQDLERQLAEIPSLDAQLSDLAPKEQQLTQLSKAAAAKKEELDAISQRISRHAVTLARTDRLTRGLMQWRGALASASRSAPEVEAGSSEPGLDPLQQAWKSVRRVQSQISTSINELDATAAQVSSVASQVTEVKLQDEATARSLRKDIEQLQGGAGAVSSAGQQLRERKAQLESLREVVESKLSRLRALAERRTIGLNRLEQIRQERFVARNEAALSVERVLGPKIRISVRRSGQFELYASVITDILRGSGLRYGELSIQLARRVSPRELLEAAEANSVAAFAKSAEITVERAARLLDQVQSTDVGDLATVLVEDDVSLQLLDGTAYKDVSDLSTGQRCTVVLPIVLRHIDHVLVVDQPEDHIDNAFIVDTLIRALIARSENSQLIFSTHNANIPVLGSADQVIQLRSDGKRGFVVRAAPLNDAEIIVAITTVMEGGAEAFKKRAEFYSKNFTI